jgi:hypothetical protein
MNLENFQNQLKSGDFARTNLYEVTLGHVKGQDQFYHSKGRGFNKEDLKFMTKAVTLPGKSLGTVDTKRFGAIFKVANDVIVDTVSMTIICSSDMRERLFFEGWMNYIYNMNKDTHLVGMQRLRDQGAETRNGFRMGDLTGQHLKYRMAYYDDYVSQVSIDTLNRQGDLAYHVSLVEAYPTNIGPIEMAWGEGGEVASFTVTFSYRDWFADIDDDGWTQERMDYEWDNAERAFEDLDIEHEMREDVREVAQSAVQDKLDEVREKAEESWRLELQAQKTFNEMDEWESKWDNRDMTEENDDYQDMLKSVDPEQGGDWKNTNNVVMVREDGARQVANANNPDDIEELEKHGWFRDTAYENEAQKAAASAAAIERANTKREDVKQAAVDAGQKLEDRILAVKPVVTATEFANYTFDADGKLKNEGQFGATTQIIGNKTLFEGMSDSGTTAMTPNTNMVEVTTSGQGGIKTRMVEEVTLTGGVAQQDATAENVISGTVTVSQVLEDADGNVLGNKVTTGEVIEDGNWDIISGDKRNAELTNITTTTKTSLGLGDGDRLAEESTTTHSLTQEQVDWNLKNGGLQWETPDGAGKRVREDGLFHREKEPVLTATDKFNPNAPKAVSKLEVDGANITEDITNTTIGAEHIPEPELYIAKPTVNPAIEGMKLRRIQEQKLESFENPQGATDEFTHEEMLEADQRHFSDKIEAGALYVNNDGNYVRTDVEIVDSTMVDPNKRESLEAAGGTNPIIAAEQELDFINIRNKAIDSEADLIYGGQNMTENMMMMDIDNDALNDADMFEIRDDYFAERKEILTNIINEKEDNTLGNKGNTGGTEVQGHVKGFLPNVGGSSNWYSTPGNVTGDKVTGYE